MNILGLTNHPLNMGSGSEEECQNCGEDGSQVRHSKSDDCSQKGEKEKDGSEDDGGNK